MAKKNELPVPDYDKVRSIAKVEKHIAECQRTITRKYGLRVQAESARSDMTASYKRADQAPEGGARSRTGRPLCLGPAQEGAGCQRHRGG
jgi:hypothetical protein